MIEIRKTASNESQHRYQLVIDGIPISFHKALVSANSNETIFSVTTRDDETSHRIIPHKLSELFPLEYLNLSFKLEWLEVLDLVFIWESGSDGKYHISFECRNFMAWKRPYSLEEYYKELYKIVGSSASNEFKINLNDRTQGLLEGFSIEFLSFSTEVPIESEIAHCADSLYKLHE